MIVETRSPVHLGPRRRSVEIAVGIAGIALGVVPILMLLYRAVPVVLRVGPQVLLHPRVVAGLPAVVLFLVLFGYAGWRHASMAIRAPRLLEAFVNHRAGVRPRDWSVSAEEILSEPGRFPARLNLAFARAADAGSNAVASDLLARTQPRLRLEGALFHALVLGDAHTAREFLALDDAALPRRLWRLLNPELARLSRAAVLLAEGDRLAGEKGLARWHRQFRFYRRSPQYVAHLWAADAMERRLAAPTALTRG